MIETTVWLGAQIDRTGYKIRRLVYAEMIDQDLVDDDLVDDLDDAVRHMGWADA